MPGDEGVEEVHGGVDWSLGFWSSIVCLDLMSFEERLEYW